MSPHSKSQATVFAILAVFCLAAQHPLSKPLAQQADSFVLARIGALIALLGVPLIFVLARGGRDWLALLSNRSALPGVVVLSGLGITSFFLYSAGLKGTHPVVVALFLNTSVLWAALWTRLLSGRSLPKAFVSTVLLAMVVIVFAASGGAMNDLFQLRLAPSNLLLLVVPALYTLKSVLATRWFGQSHPMEVSATLAVGSVFLLSPTLISRGFVRECGELWEHVSAGDLVAFGLGTLSGTVLGGAFYIMALARSEGQYAYVTAFNLLIPAISGMLAAAFAWVLHGGHAAPDVVQWVCIGLLLLVLGRFTILNQRAQVPPMRESAQQPPKSLE